MFCLNCGASVVGAFCTNCGAPQAAQKPKGFKALITKTVQNLVVSISVFAVLGLAIVGTSVFTVGANATAIKHEKLHAKAVTQVAEFLASASKFDDLAAEATVSKDQCFVNWYCSSSTYRTWIDLVNLDEAYATEARNKAADWATKVDKELASQTKAIASRTLGFILIAFEVVLLVGYLVLFFVFGRRKQ